MQSLLFQRKQDIGAGVGGVAQAGASVMDTEATNAANLQMQSIANQFNANQAGIQRTWSAQQAQNQMNFNNQQRLASQAYNTEMSNTQIQRRAEDIQKAGFNPLLAVGQLGGASSPTSPSASAGIPGGATAQAAGVAHVNGVMGPLANLALTSAQVANTQADTRKKAQDVRIATLQGDQLENDTTPEMLMARTEYLRSLYQLPTEQLNVVAQTRNLLVQQTEGASLSNISQQIHNNIDRLSYQGQQALYDQSIQTQLAYLKQQDTEAENLTAVQRGMSTPYGKAADAIAYIQTLHQAVNSGASAFQSITQGNRNIANTPPME